MDVRGRHWELRYSAVGRMSVGQAICARCRDCQWNGRSNKRISGHDCNRIGICRPVLLWLDTCAVLWTSPIRRLVIAVSWMTLVLLALFYGNRAHPYQDSPAIFSAELICILPTIALSWAIPPALLRHLRGWRLALPSIREFQAQSKSNVTVAGLLGLTTVIGLCLAVMQVGSLSYVAILISIGASVLFGCLSCLVTWILMKLPTSRIIFAYLVLGIGTFVICNWLMLLAGAGPAAQSNAVFLTSFVLAVFAGLVIARLSEIRLLTGLGEQAPSISCESESQCS